MNLAPQTRNAHAVTTNQTMIKLVKRIEAKEHDPAQAFAYGALIFILDKPVLETVVSQDSFNEFLDVLGPVSEFDPLTAVTALSVYSERLPSSPPAPIALESEGLMHHLLDEIAGNPALVKSDMERREFEAALFTGINYGVGVDPHIKIPVINALEKSVKNGYRLTESFRIVVAAALETEAMLRDVPAPGKPAIVSKMERQIYARLGAVIGAPAP